MFTFVEQKGRIVVGEALMYGEHTLPTLSSTSLHVTKKMHQVVVKRILMNKFLDPFTNPSRHFITRLSLQIK